MSLFLRRISNQLHQFSTPSPFSIHRILHSTASTQVPPSNPQFAVDYLIESCGLSSGKAVLASKKIQHLKSPDRPDAVLKFLRQTGIPEKDISAAVFRDSCILCSSVEKILRPNVEKLQEVGLTVDDISCIISRGPGAFQRNFVPKVDFWLQVLGSKKNLSVLLKRCATVLKSSIEKVIVPNLSVLEDECGLSHLQVVQVIKYNHRIITCNNETLKMRLKRAEELGIVRSSKMFMYALFVVCSLNEHIIEARQDNLKSQGLSEEEVINLVSRLPVVLKVKENSMGRKLEFLIKEMGLDKLLVITNPVLLTLSLDKRLIPRSLVLKILESKGCLGAKGNFVTTVKLTEKQFIEKFIIPNEQAVPGLYRAYTDACSGKSSAREWFKGISN